MTEGTEPNRHALGEFLKARRARLSPSACGFPVGARRRTAGLRREELAQLCEISATWYTWIEQGRDVAVSGPALARIARVLQLSSAERKYLFDLAGKRDPSVRSSPVAELPPSLRAALCAVKAPAYALGRRYEPVAWNRPAAELFTGWLGKRGAPQTLLEYVFLEPSARRFVADWPLRAKRLVAEFRADASGFLQEPEIRETVSHLAESSEDFRRYWTLHDVVEREGGLREFSHPIKGKLRFEQVNLRLAHRPELKIVVLLDATVLA